MNSTVYRRSNSNWMKSHANDRSISYWRSQARDIFARFPQVEEIEVVGSGLKSESQFLARGEKHPARNQYVIVASTGGKWGKSRADYAPRG